MVKTNPQSKLQTERCHYNPSTCCQAKSATMDGKVFVQDLRAVHAKDLNFVLRTEIYVYWDGQLRASHLILGVEPVYSTWQPFKQALIVDSPLLSYIDVRYVNFLPPKLTTGEAREFGRRFTCADELAPLRDESAEKASRRLREIAHEAIQQGDQAQGQPIPENPAAVPQQQVTEAAALLAKAIQPSGRMVSRKVMSIERFVLGARQPNQPPPSQGRGQVPQPPPSSQAGHARKKQKVTDQPSTGPGDATVQTPPRPTGGIVIHESPTEACTGDASSSQVAPVWKPKFLLDGKPLPSTACVRMWEKGEGGRIAQTLAEALLLPEDVHAFEEGSEESVGCRLEWHAIAAAQMAHIVAARARELAEENEREKGARESAVKTAKEKLKAAESAEKKAAAAEKNRALAEKRYAELLTKQNETEVKLAEAISLNTSNADEIADLRAGLSAAEQKWYDVGFADAENSAEPVVARARNMGFEAGWFAALQAMGVPEDSQLRDPGQIPFPNPVPAVQNAPAAIDEEETASMRELVEQIDSHAEPEEMEATSIPTVQELLGEDPPFPLTVQQEVTPPTQPPS
ncbi:uncharacterized protein LOC126710237 [Quercus robur]|uniref:uncharacterized protein LOC126710237 n=1 Tax=Quercus robur TaxID=38942 RepID=UPI002163F322|nr:uncharacterized protein LOC126710237 [Quercus robur]